MPDDVVRLKGVVSDLVKALRPFARHSYGGWDAESKRRYSINVTEGQVARAGILIMRLEDQGIIKRRRNA